MKHLYLINRSYDPNSGAVLANNPILDWQTGVNYKAGDDRENDGVLYRAEVDHVGSADFSTDLNAAPPKWRAVEKESTLTKTAAYTMNLEDRKIHADATAGAFAVTLPSAVKMVVGRIYTVKKIDNSANGVTLTPVGAQTIDGAASKVISAPNFSYSFYSDGTNLFIA